MSEWITDRAPTAEDADCYGNVWITYNGEVIAEIYDEVTERTPWMPRAKPEPYKAPSRYTVVPNAYIDGKWVVLYDKILVADNIHTCEAAERIAAIYNEVMP